MTRKLKQGINREYQGNLIPWYGSIAGGTYLDGRIALFEYYRRQELRYRLRLPDDYRFVQCDEDEPIIAIQEGTGRTIGWTGSGWVEYRIENWWQWIGNPWSHAGRQTKLLGRGSPTVPQAP